MYTVIKGALALGEDWERVERWVPFHDLVRESGTARSFVRLSSVEASEVAVKVGGKVAEVLVRKGSDAFEIVLYRPSTSTTGPVLRASGRSRA